MSSIIELINLKVRGRSHVSLRFVLLHQHGTDGTNASNKKKKSDCLDLDHAERYVF